MTTTKTPRALACSKCNTPTRVGYTRTNKAGSETRRVRVCPSCGRKAQSVERFS